MENEIKNIIKEFANPREETLDDAVKRICALFNVVGQSEQLFCRDCKYDKAESEHDKMWCRDCQQKDRFKAK